MLTGVQMRMARAALDLTTREFGALIGISGMAISRYERGDYRAISVATANRAADYFREQKVFFGPMNAVCYGTDLFSCSNYCRYQCREEL